MPLPLAQWELDEGWSAPSKQEMQWSSFTDEASMGYKGPNNGQSQSVTPIQTLKPIRGTYQNGQWIELSAILLAREYALDKHFPKVYSSLTPGQ